MTAKDIQKTLATNHWNYLQHVCIPNCCFSGYEEDFIVLHESGFMEVAEIKISSSDFKREFSHKAAKHQMLLNGREVHLSEEEYKAKRHLKTVRPTGWGTGIEKGAPHLVRRFWFAMPYDLAVKHTKDIPEYAGLLGVRSRVSVNLIKKAPNLKLSRKLTIDEQLAIMRLATQRYWKIHLKA